jgi:imidazolonepropionase-like amidohydrolase
MLGWWASAAWAGWVVTGATLLDAEGSRQAEALVVEGDRIVHIGALSEAYRHHPRVDGTGLTVMPGLIDAHVHLSMAPGGAFADRSEADRRARRAEHLRAYVASGVVAVLDTGSVLDDAYEIAGLASRGVAPQIRWLGPLVSPPGGYVAAVLPSFEPTPDAQVLQSQLESFDPLGPIGVKVTMEDGMLRPIWPWQVDEVLDALAEQERPLFVHAMEPEEYRLALDRLPVAAFVHPLDDPDEELIERLQTVPVVTTLSVMDSLLLTAEPQRLDDPLLRRVVPADELAAAADRATVRASYRAVADSILPRAPGVVRALAAGAMSQPGPLKGRVRKLSKAVAELHAGGVTLVMGSDSGNWPVFLTEFHGATSVREVELLAQAGLPPLDVLAIATRNGAELLGLGDELGTLEVGKQASFLAVRGDPLTDWSLLRDPVWVSLRGQRKTPDQWMAP